jgi:uncharacterized membrane protein
MPTSRVQATTLRQMGDTQTMAGVPSDTLYSRLLGWHAPDLRRAVIVFVIGLIVALVLLRFLTWRLALVGGWDAAALTFLAVTWPIIIRADSSGTQQLATREDTTRGTARLLLLGASVTSLVGVGFALTSAGRESGLLRVLLIGVAGAIVNTCGSRSFKRRPGRSPRRRTVSC